MDIVFPEISYTIYFRLRFEEFKLYLFKVLRLALIELTVPNLSLNCICISEPFQRIITWNYWCIGKKKHFWFYKYCSTYTLKFYAAANIYTLDSLTSLHRQSRDIRVIIELWAIVILRLTFRRTEWSFKTYRYNPFNTIFLLQNNH